jgi:Flp pilus assembly protein TadD
MAFRVNLNPLLIDIPAGSSNYVVEDNYRLPVDVDVLAVNPHAHYLAKRMEGWANLPDGSRKDLLLIKDWDFNWQGDYRYKSPVTIPKGTTLAMRFTYDNSSANIRNPSSPPKRVKYGLQTTDEMAELWFQVLAHNADDRNTLAQDFYVHLAYSALSYNEQASKDNPKDAEAHTRAGRALVFFNRFPEAMQHFQAAVNANPKYDRGWYELGYINLRLNKLPEAQQAFEQVVKLNPDDFEAQGSLGYIAMQKGDLNNAETHFKTALEINPADEIARDNLAKIQQAKAASSPAGTK